MMLHARRQQAMALLLQLLLVLVLQLLAAPA
jgi:hypothetical protein